MLPFFCPGLCLEAGKPDALSRWSAGLYSRVLWYVRDDSKGSALRHGNHW